MSPAGFPAPSELAALLERARALVATREYGRVAELLARLSLDALLAEPELGVLRAESLRRAGERPQALRLVEALAPVCRRRGNDTLLRNLLNLQGILFFEQGNVARAEASWRWLLDAASRARDEEFVARANQNLGIIFTLTGRRDSAVATYQRAIVSYRRLGYLRGLAQAHHNLAITYREMDFPREAEQAFRRAAAYARADGSKDEVARVEQEWALLMAFGGDFPLARATAARALARFRELGEPGAAAEAVRVLGVIALWQSDTAEAERQLAHALATARQTSLRLLEAETLEGLAVVALARGDDDRADALRAEATAIFGSLNATGWGEELRTRMLAGPRSRQASEAGD